MKILYRFPSRSFIVLILTFMPTLRLLFPKQKPVRVCFILCGQRALAAADVSGSSFLAWARGEKWWKRKQEWTNPKAIWIIAICLGKEGWECSLSSNCHCQEYLEFPWKETLEGDKDRSKRGWWWKKGMLKLTLWASGELHMARHSS